ncbi:MAG TPA: archease [Bryobacteraceae bacterium]|nr:archease [Bryobacteraceae bacterium]
MPPFEILEHTADVGFRAHGANLKSLFENAALAMVSIAADLGRVEPREPFALTTDGTDGESLLVNWLSEVLWWWDAKRIAFREFHISEMDAGHVRAIGLGEPWDAARHRAKLIIKAVTYHQLKIAETREGWSAEVFLDV